MSAVRKTHVALSVRGALRGTKKSLKGLFKHPTLTRSQTPDEARETLLDLLSKGVEMIAFSACDNFDIKTGCKGHWVDNGDDADPGDEHRPAPRISLRKTCRITTQFHPAPDWTGQIVSSNARRTPCWSYSLYDSSGTKLTGGTASGSGLATVEKVTQIAAKKGYTHASINGGPMQAIGSDSHISSEVLKA